MVEFDASASIAVGTDDTPGELAPDGKSKPMSTHGQLRGRTIDNRPHWHRRSASEVAVTGVATQIKLGGPNVGRILEIVGLVVIGSDDHTVIAGTTVALYAGASTSTMVSLGDLVLPGSQGGSAVTVPSNAQWGRYQFVLTATEKLYVVVNGASTGQNLLATVLSWDWDEEDYLRKLSKP